MRSTMASFAVTETICKCLSAPLAAVSASCMSRPKAVPVSFVRRPMMAVCPATTTALSVTPGTSIRAFCICWARSLGFSVTAARLVAVCCPAQPQRRKQSGKTTYFFKFPPPFLFYDARKKFFLTMENPVFFSAKKLYTTALLCYNKEKSRYIRKEGFLWKENTEDIIV